MVVVFLFELNTYLSTIDVSVQRCRGMQVTALPRIIQFLNVAVNTPRSAVNTYQLLYSKISIPVILIVLFKFALGFLWVNDGIKTLLWSFPYSAR